MAFHELTINAVKYGSLSSRRGSLRVSWMLDVGADRCFRILWRERDGPAVTAPQRKGFGTLLIDKLFTTQTGARVQMNYRPQGLEAKFEMSLPVEEGRGNGRAQQSAQPAPGASPRLSAVTSAQAGDPLANSNSKVESFS